MEMKASDDGWRVEGWASDYGEDLQGDVVIPGAFRETLARHPRPPLLFAHQHDKILGVPLELREASGGLWGRWKISKTSLGAEVRQLLLDKAVDGLSIGYVPRQARPGKSGARELHQLDLLEVSVVAIPANPRALVTDVKTGKPAGWPGARDAGGLHLRMELVRRKLRRAGILDHDFRVVGASHSAEADLLRRRLTEARRRLERLGVRA
jgi:HK97 family phage prohead protease